VVERCDDTVDKKRVNSCVLKYLFLERVGQPKISPKNPGSALSDALLMSCYQNLAAHAAKKQTALCFFETALRAVLINEWVRIDSGPNNLRSCFLHWYRDSRYVSSIDMVQHAVKCCKCNCSYVSTERRVPREALVKILKSQLATHFHGTMATLAIQSAIILCTWVMSLYTWVVTLNNESCPYMYESCLYIHELWLQIISRVSIYIRNMAIPAIQFAIENG